MYNTIQDFLQEEDITKIFSQSLSDITFNYLGFFSTLKIESKIEASRYFYSITFEKKTHIANFDKNKTLI